MNKSRKVILVTLAALTVTVLFAQEKPKKGEPELRTIRGTVVDKDETPIDSAVIYLKNMHTQDIITHISDPDGQFRFTGLDLNVDFEIHAEHDGRTSSSRSISSFDTRKEYVLTLKLDHQRPAK